MPFFTSSHNCFFKFCLYLKRWNQSLRNPFSLQIGTKLLSIGKIHFLRNAVWPDLTKFHHLWQFLCSLCKFLYGFLAKLGKNFNRLWQKCNAIGQIFIVTNGEILNKYTNYLVTLEERALKNFGSEKLNELLSSLLQVSQGDVPRALAER